jgi:hypothetical protein
MAVGAPTVPMTQASTVFGLASASPNEVRVLLAR